MKRFDNWLNKVSRWITGGSFLGRLVWVLCIGVLLVLGYNLLQQVRADANSVAAVAGALAAFAALHAAKESQRTAQEASRALAMATKPVPEIRMVVNKSESQPGRATMTIEVENLSVHPIKGGRLEWLLRDGTSGSHPIGEIRGRLTPYGGMFHSVEGVASIDATPAFNDGIAGEDRVTLDYYGDSRAITWRATLAIEWKVLPQQWTERDGHQVPVTTRHRFERSEVEL